MQRRTSPVYLLSKFLLYFSAALILTVSCFLLAGTPVGSWQLLVALLAASYALKWQSGDWKSSVYTALAGVLVLLICAQAAGAMYDTAWDGAAYHKPAVGLLKEGWNPVYMSSPAFNEITGSIEASCDGALLWTDYYPKATYYFAASFYTLTGNIESGKCYQMVFALICFGFFWEFCRRKRMNAVFSALVASFAAFSPIMLAQVTTYYLDSVVSAVLMVMILVLCAFFDHDWEKQNRDFPLTIFSLIAFAINLKYSAIGFAATLCGVFFLYCLIQKDMSPKAKWRMFGILACSCVIAFCVVGFAPYITNLRRYGQLLPGLSGLLAGQPDAMFGILGLSNPQRFLLSLFGRMSHGNHNTVGELLKIPFTYDAEELGYYAFPDTRISGFGVLFSGILLFCVVALIVKACDPKLRKKRVFQLFLIFIVISYLEALALSVTFQQRYVPHLYALPVGVLLLLLLDWGQAQDKPRDPKTILKRAAGCALAVLMAWNSVFFVSPIAHRFSSSARSIAEFERLAQLDKTNQVTIALWVDYFGGLLYNLKDHGIQYDHVVPADQMGDSRESCMNDRIYYEVRPDE